MQAIIVAQDGTGDYRFIQEAIDAAIEHQSIYIQNGIYEEKLVIEKSDITLVGQDPFKTIIRYKDFANKQMPDHQKMGTFRSYTALFGGDRLHVRHLTIENAAGSGPEIGQAIAAYVDGDDIRFTNCRFLGNQDTLFTGPLPPAPKIHGSFVGPREGVPFKRSWQHYESCYIEGDVDFIFGSATAFFDHCEIHSKNRHLPVNGYITAASTPETESIGYVFRECNLTSDTNTPSVYLGRPWRAYAKVSWHQCNLGAHILPAGWDDWDLEENQRTVEFCEYLSEGPGACPEKRVPWAKNSVLVHEL